jgi:hypothetical protein
MSRARSQWLACSHPRARSLLDSGALAGGAPRKRTTMSNKQTDQQQREAATPFFAHLLTTQRDPAASMAPTGGPAPTYHCLDSECTKKYPSDDDESTTYFKDADW